MTPQEQPSATRSVTPLILAKIRSRTATSGLEAFIAKEIGIPAGAREQASISQNALRDFLIGLSDSDQFFPYVLQTKDADFLGGSFPRHTKTWPLDDIDIYIPLDGVGLFYLMGGFPLPYDVVTDGLFGSNPILSDPARWMDGTTVSSFKLVQEFKKVLRQHYPLTPVKDSEQAVNIQMQYGETGQEKGLGFDVVPCFSLRPHNLTEHPFYLIPDGRNGWIRTNPKLDIEIAKQLHADNNETYRKVVKLVKFWNKNRFGSKLGSYYVELAIMRSFREKNAAGTYFSNLPDALWAGFQALHLAALAGDLPSWLPSAPNVERGWLSSDDLKDIEKASKRAMLAWVFDAGGKVNEALRELAAIFGPTFQVTE